MWDADARQVVRTLRGHTSNISSVAWSPDGRWLASASSDATVRLWTVDSNEPVQTLKHAIVGSQEGVAWSPNSKSLVTGTHEGKLLLWESKTGKLLESLTGHKSGIWSVAWCADGRFIASAGDDITVRLWDGKSFDPVRVLQGHVAPVRSVVFSPDGEAVASADLAGVIRIWETTTGRPLQTLVTLDTSQGLVLSRDGHHHGLARPERKLVYIVQTDSGQETLTPEEFSAKYDWQNDPERVRLTQ